MKINYNYDSHALSTEPSGEVSILNAGSGEYSVLVNALGYENYRVDYRDFYIKNQDLQKNFELVDNFNGISFRDRDKKFFVYSPVYKNINHNYFISIDTESHLEKTEKQKQSKKLANVYFKPYEKETVEVCKKDLNKFIYQIEDNSSKVSVVIKTNHGFNFKQHTIKPLDVDVESMYNDSFKSVHEHVVQTLTNSDKGIVMFHGTPGTGKTNYIKHLTTLVQKKNFIFIPVSIIPFLTDPSFIDNLIDHKNSVLILEDCENFLKDREFSKNGDVVSIILNLSDGILSDIIGVQIICTFNSKLTKIDDALLRKGRLIDDYYFDKLDIEKAQKLVDKQGIDYLVKEKMTLSDVFNLEDEGHRSKPKQKKIGF